MVIAGLIDALHFAERDDASAVLYGLGDAQVAAGIATARLPLPVAVTDFVLDTAGSTDTGRTDTDSTDTDSTDSTGSASVLALTHRALADETVTDPDAVLRALIRLANPAVDDLLLRTVAKRPRAWILAALVRDRRDAHGRPVITNDVERFLRNQVARAERRHANRHTPMPARIEIDLVVAATVADQPWLAMTAMPLAVRLEQTTAVAHGLRTLRDHGLLADVWEDGLRETILTHAKKSSYYQPQWDAVLAFGDTGDDPRMTKAPASRLRFEGLPDPGAADAWTAPNTGSQHYALAWDRVLEYAALVGTGEQDRQAGQATARGLDEAAAREDVPEDVRAEFEARYPRAMFWAARPDVATLRRAHAAKASLNPATRHFATRELLRRGLLHGSLSAPEAVAHAEPAAEVLALALPTPPGLTTYYTAKGKNGFAPHFVRIPPEAEERYQADLRAAVVAALGPDPVRWLKVLTRVAAWEGSLGDLLAAIDTDQPPPLPTRRGSRWPRGVDPAAVLLELAPPEVVAAVVEAAGLLPDAAEFFAPETRALAGVLTRVLDRGPEPRWLLNLALDPHGTPAMRLAAARNPAATVGTLWRLADREPAEPRVLAAVYLHPLASLELRIAALVRSEAAGGLYPGLVRRLVTRYAEPALLQPTLESRDPELLHNVLRRSNRALQTDRRVVAYSRLAEAAGPEPVWALELERAGSLDKMHEAVRASMTEHSDEPLHAAATGIARPDPERVAASWDADFQSSRPDTAERVRGHLDGRPELWMRLAEDGVTLHGLLAELEGVEPRAPLTAQAGQAAQTPEPPTPTAREPKPRLSQTPRLLPPLPGSDPSKPPTP